MRIDFAYKDNGGGGEGVPLTKTITENGTYNYNGGPYKPVNITVKVSDKPEPTHDPTVYMEYEDGRHESVTYEDGIVPDFVFSKAGIKSLRFGYGITEIGDTAFANNFSLGYLILPESLRKIKDAAFAGLESVISLTNIVIPEGVTEIGGLAFFLNYAEYIELPSTLQTVGDRAFDYCGYSKQNIVIKLAEGCNPICGDSAFNINPNNVYLLVKNGTNVQENRVYQALLNSGKNITVGYY